MAAAILRRVRRRLREALPEMSTEQQHQDVYLCGMSREVHVLLSERMTDENWCDLALAIKADYGRVGEDKSAVLKSLEHWVIFPNKFVEIANICAELHAEILDNMGGYQLYKTRSHRDKEASAQSMKLVEQLTARAGKLYQHSLLQMRGLCKTDRPAFRGV